ncbi:MAG: sodium:solute symporter [Sphingobacteriales bacterium 17-39-43]|uniref:sodium:solute symporter n=1 Tax=Daejeonella sp. TaxID=2805397 RepID=UPI000BC81AD2|nr:sodium:solute symporter [Daejeonella sp.]OYZ28912.1 MAG: sodium:solute symporter [Sphingobacteriales bacterium 16-39-50]OZA22229.1 MAG: sodium:solute symporter [Sphingobacteriales bacterium 17-39-43]HQT22520.1 sodium:solute symporter [Daejeonella sp.]HQT59518.1 sodium:solute symporter [Daejeonella sp.]
MAPGILLSFLIGYFLMLLGISYFTSKKSSDNSTFFTANRNSKWYLVAFGMIGTALSGVTFISVPGEVGNPAGNEFKYFQFVLGNAIGFIIIATVLLPLYYRMKLTSIYTYIEERLGTYSYKTAASIFLLSRTIGSSFRLYLVVIVLQRFIFDSYGVPFWATVLISLALIWSYTFKGGLKTIIITDTLQTLFLVSSVVLTIYFICDSLGLNLVQAFDTIKNSGYSKVFFYEDFMTSKFHVSKQLLGGIFVTIAMVGLDQDMMQKNLSCNNIREAQKNMFTFTTVFVIVNIFFLSVGALLYIYASKNGIELPLDHVTGKPRTDFLFPEIAFNHLTMIPAVVFMLGLTAATFATTDSALTALTTSFCVDFLGFSKREDLNSKAAIRTRHTVHIGLSLLMFTVIILFNIVNNAAVVSAIFTVASYTYGPLLGLYGFGLFMKNRGVKDKLVPFICLLSPAICFFLNANSKTLMGGYIFDNELIVVNGLITFIGLLLISKPATSKTQF